MSEYRNAKGELDDFNVPLPGILRDSLEGGIAFNSQLKEESIQHLIEGRIVGVYKCSTLDMVLMSTENLARAICYRQMDDANRERHNLAPWGDR